MKALILYNDFRMATKAKATLQRATKRADAAVSWNVHLQSLGALRQPNVAEEILLDALDAHLILFASDPAQFLPLFVYEWLEQWAELRLIPGAALAVTTEASEDCFGNADCEISRIAGEHELTFIKNEKPVAPKRTKLFVRSGREEGFPVAVLQATSGTARLTTARRIAVA